MKKLDPVQREIAITDFQFGKQRVFAAMSDALAATTRLAHELSALSIEAALFAKDDPFCEDGSPCEAAMGRLRRLRRSNEQLNDLRLIPETKPRSDRNSAG